MRKADDEWVEIMYSRYNQLLTEFSEVKGMIIPEPDVEAELELLKGADVLLKFARKMAEGKEASN